MKFIILLSVIALTLLAGPLGVIVFILLFADKLLAKDETLYGSAYLFVPMIFFMMCFSFFIKYGPSELLSPALQTLADVQVIGSYGKTNFVEFGYIPAFAIEMAESISVILVTVLLLFFEKPLHKFSVWGQKLFGPGIKPVNREETTRQEVIGLVLFCTLSLVGILLPSVREESRILSRFYGVGVLSLAPMLLLIIVAIAKLKFFGRK